jgi:hypothetical protein
MNSSVYKINKGVNKPIEFKGLKAQYIWYLGGALVGLLILFAILYISGVNPYFSVALVLLSGAFAFKRVYHLSNKYGEHGMTKKIAKRRIPKQIKSYSRKSFIR